MHHSRRYFLTLLGSLPLLLRGKLPSGATSASAGRWPSQASSLDPGLVQALADAVLPSELGVDGVRRASSEFLHWIAAYRAGAELLHPYGSAQVRYTEPLPLSAWRAQLLALERASQSQYSRSFAELERHLRADLVREALSATSGDTLPSPAAAPHVALALLGWFYDSPAATNLCYRARIDPLQCRPLGDSSRRPLPLAPEGNGSAPLGTAHRFGAEVSGS
jgi:hypothetical protein